VASIYREIRIDAPPERVWDALLDVGALHRRLARGFVTDVRLEEGARLVTFANGIVARELIVAVDEERRRLVWSVVGGRMTHHNASAQVFPDGGRGSRFVWIADLLPHELARDLGDDGPGACCHQAHARRRSEWRLSQWQGPGSGAKSGRNSLGAVTGISSLANAEGMKIVGFMVLSVAE